MEYPIPARSAAAFQRHRNAAPQNASLIFERFAPDTRKQQAKKYGLESAARAAALADDELLRAWRARWETAVRAFKGEPFSMRTDWRLVAGLGRKGPLEVGFAFHRYGFPVLPGSAVKGIARAYAVLVEHRQESDPEFATIFGRVAQSEKETVGSMAGKAVFFDAIPAVKPQLELDIMNCHYPDYYQQKQAPASWQSPVPVYFLTVAPNTEFRFAVGWRGVTDDDARRLRELAERWLVQGLEDLGVGAKSGAGYGRFRALVAAADTDLVGAGAPGNSLSPSVDEVVERHGVIVQIRPDKWFGRVRDVETGREYRFDTRVVRGNTPATKSRVVFQVQGDRIVALWREQP